MGIRLEADECLSEIGRCYQALEDCIHEARKESTVLQAKEWHQRLLLLDIIRMRCLEVNLCQIPITAVFYRVGSTVKPWY